MGLGKWVAHPIPPEMGWAKILCLKWNGKWVAHPIPPEMGWATLQMGWERQLAQKPSYHGRWCHLTPNSRVKKSRQPESLSQCQEIKTMFCSQQEITCN